jgi:hypothetical protein
MHKIGAHESNECEEAATVFGDLVPGAQEKKGMRATALWTPTAFSDLPTNW